MGFFWSSFWPSVAATLVGVIVGLPFALGINRYAVSLGERARPGWSSRW